MNKDSIKNVDKKREDKILKLPMGATYSSDSSVARTGYTADYDYASLPVDLTLDNRNKTYFKMGMNSTISSVLNLYASLLQTIKWSVRKPRGKEIDKNIVSLFDNIIHDMEHPWLEFVEHALSFIQYGWVAFEIILKKRKDGKIGVKKLQYIPQFSKRKWEVNSNGEVIGLVQQGNEYNGFKDTFIPKEKLLMIKNIGIDNSPEGKSILIGAYEDWKTFEISENSLRTTMVKSFVGIPKVEIPSYILEAANANDEDYRFTESDKKQARLAYNSYLDIATKMTYSAETGIVIPSDTYTSETGNISSVKQYDVSLMSMNGQPLVDINAVRVNTEARMARVLQGDFLQMGTSGKTGTYSLGNTRYDMFANAVNVVADKIATVINEELFRVLGLFNNIDLDKLPILHHKKVNEMSIKEKIETLAQYMFATGTILPDENIDMALREELDLPLDEKRPEGWKPQWVVQEYQAQQTQQANPGKTIDDTSKKTRASGKNNINNNK